MVLSDGHGATAREFNGSACTCTSEARCCDPAIDAPPAQAPAAPAFATLYCRHAYDVSVPTIIEDLLDTVQAPLIPDHLLQPLCLPSTKLPPTFSPDTFVPSAMCDGAAQRGVD